jgi:ParB family chromosome partitioning protein
MRKALGKGIGALIPSAPGRRSHGDAAPDEPSAAQRGPVVRQLPISVIELNPRQPRVRFDEQAIEDLARSITERGILQPVLVRELADGRFELIAGERRLRAARIAGIDEIPAIVKEANDSESLVIALVENVQRADLGPLEEARAFQALMQEFSLTQEEVARRVGKSRPAIANTLRLLQLPEEAQKELEAGRMTAGHARALLALDSDRARASLTQEIVHRKLSVRDAERAAAARSTRSSTPRVDHDVRRMEADLARALGTKVTIQPARDGSGGQVQASYYSNDDLARLVELLLTVGKRAAARLAGN